MIVFGSAIDRSGVYLQTVSLENPKANTAVKYDKANALSRHLWISICDFFFSDLPKHAGKKGANSCHLLAVNMN